MNKPLFTNIVVVSQKKERILNFLGNLKNLLKWNSDIATVEIVNGTTEITRTRQSLNDKEFIQVEQSGDFVTYHCKGERLNYQVIFEVSHEGNMSQITETVILLENSRIHLPLKLLKPITKHAFATNLDQLAVILE